MIIANARVQSRLIIKNKLKLWFRTLIIRNKQATSSKDWPQSGCIMNFNYLNQFPWTSQSKIMQKKFINLGKMVLVLYTRTKNIIKLWDSKYIYQPFEINFRKTNSITGIGMCLWTLQFILSVSHQKFWRKKM